MMLQKNDFIDVNIHDLGYKGEGVGRADNMVLYIPNAIPGDTVSAKILKVKKTYGYAKKVQILEKSKYRVEAPCPVNEQCGGCQIQTMSYDAQLKFKENTLRACLERIGGITTNVNPILGMASPFHYRNKMQFAVGGTSSKPEIGLYKVNSHDIVNINACPVQHTLSDAVIVKFKQFITDHKLSIYDEETHTGLIRHLVIRNSYSNDTMMIYPVINSKSVRDFPVTAFVEEFRTLAGVKSLYLNHNTQKGDTILGHKNKHLYGEPHLIETIGHVSYAISPLAFFQTNPLQTLNVYQRVLDRAELSQTDIVWDLYCGSGTIGLFLAKYCSQVVGVEINSAAVKDGQINIELNNVKNVAIYEGQVEDLEVKMTTEMASDLNHKKPDVVILDPPRKGCDTSVIEYLMKLKPEKIVYVSCNPSTLARDLKILSERYVVETVDPVDMFPHTVHVETVTRLTIKS